jgi:hypothetical protein
MHNKNLRAQPIGAWRLVFYIGEFSKSAKFFNSSWSITSQWPVPLPNRRKIPPGRGGTGPPTF